MRAVVLLLWSTMTLASCVVMSVAVLAWVREVLRGTDRDEREPSPVNERVAPFMVVAALAVAAVRLLRDEPFAFLDTVFPAVFIGFALSCAWYLLARRDGADEPQRRGTVDAVSLAVAGAFGALSAVASG